MDRIVCSCYPVLAAAVVLLPAPRADASTVVVVGQTVPASQRIAAEQIDHQPWDRLLKKYVDRRGLVDYRGWHASATDRNNLRNYLTHLSAASFSAQTTNRVKLAFWINAYNAVTIEGILREYPTSSIRNHTAKLLGYNIWDDLQLPVDGQQYSLNQIEHEVLRALQEPRIHFVIVCASRGCPVLSDDAYLPATIDDQLATAARAFFSDPQKLRVDEAANRVWASPILDWFGDDFGATPAARMQQIAPWAPPPAQPLLRSGRAELRFLSYDWSLNDQAPEGRPNP